MGLRIMLHTIVISDHAPIDYTEAIESQAWVALELVAAQLSTVVPERGVPDCLIVNGDRLAELAYEGQYHFEAELEAALKRQGIPNVMVTDSFGHAGARSHESLEEHFGSRINYSCSERPGGRYIAYRLERGKRKKK
jgi:NDP-sugar pyrophosphorylase family protein